MLENLKTLIDAAVEDETFETVERGGTKDGYSFYGIAKLINELLAEYGLSTTTSQYIRTFAKSGKIDGQVYQGLKNVRFGEDDVQKFATNFVAARVHAEK
jgi:hypothetical protein